MTLEKIDSAEGRGAMMNTGRSSLKKEGFVTLRKTLLGKNKHPPSFIYIFSDLIM